MDLYGQQQGSKLPAHDRITYWRDLITLALLLLALPYLAYQLVRRPGAVLKGATRQHVKT